MPSADSPENWYESWFDTPFYHILYQDRDYEEAAYFMRALSTALDIQKEDHILDLACGRGRHSIYLNRLGHRVTGVDLSGNSIAFAKAQLQNPQLQQSTPSLQPLDASRIEFRVHDMTQPMDQAFDVVLNLFTSFGYFQTEADNLKAIKAIKKSLKPGGKAVIDFMNTPFILQNLVPENQKTESGITFTMNRRHDSGFIYKDIHFTTKEKVYHFTEKVRAFQLEDFQSLYDQAGLELVDLYGSYKLEDYDKKTSERMIMVLKRQ